MSARELLTRLRNAQVELTARGDRIHYRARPGALTPELLEGLRRHKDEVLALLAEPPARQHGHHAHGVLPADLVAHRLDHAPVAAYHLDDPPTQVMVGDCLRVLPTLPAGCAQLVFIDPPFNIGLEYPGYDDSRPEADYLAWLGAAFEAACRVLGPAGSLWVQMTPRWLGKVSGLLEGLGLCWRRTVVWHYTFGPAQQRNLTPSWQALLYFVRDPGRFTFHADAVRVPSARQLVYGDRRARAGGKVPDDVWFVRPQEAEPEGFFDPAGDVWHVRRENGTFKGRVGHSCQTPLAVVERIIRLCSNPGDLVLDPMCGTGTVLVASRRLGRRSIGIELSDATAALARERLMQEGRGR
jgi:site-specific DNA-methyltransferase (adenine-specific)